MEFYRLDPDRTMIAPVSDIPAVQNLVEVKTSQPKLDSTDDLGTDTSGDDTDTDTETDGSDYLSFDESDIEDTYPETKAEREAREHERQLVLEAAGLIVKQDVKPPPRPPRKPKSSKRRPPPVAPERLSSNTSTSSLKGLPPVPPTESETSAHLNDAFDRYEAFRYTHANVNRMSVASSMDSAPPSSPTISTISQTPSKEGPGESRYSSIMHFLGRKTPEAEKRLVISAPILNSPKVNSAGLLVRLLEVCVPLSFWACVLFLIFGFVCSLGLVLWIDLRLKGSHRKNDVDRRRVGPYTYSDDSLMCFERPSLSSSRQRLHMYMICSSSSRYE